MKRQLCILLALVLLLGLSACSGAPAQAEPAAEPWLLAGFARADITPAYSVGLDGSGNAESRLSKGILDPLYTTCVALKDASNRTILIFTIDTCGMNRAVLNNFRNKVSTHTQIPATQIFVGSTHTHSAPVLSRSIVGDEYIDTFFSAAIRAASLAIADLSPATLHAATKDLEGMNFVRHYKMSDGSYAGPNFGTFDGPEITDYAGTTDPELSLIKLDRDGDKKDILMLNWQAHPNRSSELGYYLISADFVGALRDKLEHQTDMHVAYFTGASGNVHIDSMIESDMHGMNWKQYGEKLAELTVDAMSGLKPVGGTGIKTVHVDYVAEVDHSMDHMLPVAEEVYNVWKTQGKDAGNALGRTYGFSSIYQAKTIIERAPLAQQSVLDLCAFRVGNIGFTTGTYEMFAEAGKYVKDNSPFDVTFIIAGNRTYIPTEESFSYHSYEADTSFYVMGTSEALTERYVEMLHQVK